MTTPSWIASLADPTLKADMTAAAASGTVTEAAMATLFTDLANELTANHATLSASQFNDLKTIAANLNVGETASPYVTYIVNALVNGNAANASWTGGGTSPTSLGNLAVGATATQLNELTGKWLLGTDLPSDYVSMSGYTPFSITYSPVSAPLFSGSGPSINDINQGYLGDCFLLGPLAEVAQQNPSIIESMITNNGNGTYGVRFYVDGVAQYVTVNSELPDGGTIFNTANGANNAPDDWAALVEKAYTQLQASGVVTGNNVNDGNSFSTIGNGGYPENTLEEITGASSIVDYKAAGSSWTLVQYNDALGITGSVGNLSTTSVFAALAADLAAGDDLVLSSYTNAFDSSGNQTLVADHALSIYGVNAATGVLDIRNPWGVEVGQYWDTTFAVSLSTLLVDGDIISVADPPTTPITIASNGTTNLVAVAGQFALDPASGGSGPFLTYGGNTVTAGEFGSWTPIGAVKTAGGYEVAWKETGADAYTIWSTDANGNYLSNLIGVVSGESYTLEEAEVTFGEDLNGDGTIGPPTTTIATSSTTKLVEVANQFALDPAGGGSGPFLTYGGNAVTAGEFGSWTPIGAVKTASGYKVAWKETGADAYTIWSTDANGNYLSNITGVVSGESYTLEEAEVTFGEDLNGDGTIGPPTTTIATSSTTKLVEVAVQFALDPASGGSGPFLMYGGNAVIAGEFGSWTPIGAVQTAGGYEVAWKEGAADAYTIWNTDSNGNYLGNIIGAVSATAFDLLSGNQSATGSGNALIAFTGSNDTFLDSPGVYNDTIVGFSQAQGDRIHLTTDTVANALMHTTLVDGGQDTMITLANTSTITLMGITHVDSTYFS
jgi:hypothetical protein